MHALLVFIVLSSLSYDWIEFQSVFGRFSVQLPKWPVENLQHIPTPNGDLNSYIFTVELSDTASAEVAYLVSFTDFPPSVIHSDKKHTLDQFFKNSMLGAAGNVGGKIASNKTIIYKSFPGREFTIFIPKKQQTLHQRLYLVNSRTYTLQVITTGKHEPSGNMIHFFDSFKIW